MKIVLGGLGLVVLVAVSGVVLYLELRPPRRQARPPAQKPPLLVGVDDDALKWTADPLAIVRRAQALGAGAMRVSVPWTGARRPGRVRRTELTRAELAARHTNVVLAVYGPAARSPLTAWARRRFCGYARAALALVPDARAVVVWNEANSRTYFHGGPAAYERLLARCYDALHAQKPGITVLDSTASAHAPGAFLRALGRAYRASGRRAPLVDAFGHNPYPRTSAEQPWATHAPGFLGLGDYRRLASVLHAAFAGTPQHSLAVWYLEDGYQTAVPAHLSAHYSGRETSVTITPAEQARRLAESIRLAACQPTVRAFFNFELTDEPRLTGWQSGLVWQSSTPKPAAAAFAAAVHAVHGSHADCPTPPSKAPVVRP